MNASKNTTLNSLIDSNCSFCVIDPFCILGVRENHSCYAVLPPFISSANSQWRLSIASNHTSSSTSLTFVFLDSTMYFTRTHNQRVFPQQQKATQNNIFCHKAAGNLTAFSVRHTLLRRTASSCIETHCTLQSLSYISGTWVKASTLQYLWRMRQS